MRNESKTRLLTIYGPSVSGKSSLARAGLIPELARRPLPGRDRARVAVLVPGSHPLEALATILARIATQDPISASKTREFVSELKQVNGEGGYDGLRRIADALPESATSPLIILVDQLEEVFTLCEDASEQVAFIGNLLCAGGDHLASNCYCDRHWVNMALGENWVGSVGPHLCQFQVMTAIYSKS